MKLLVAGRTGQVASALRARTDIAAVALGRPQLDITDFETLQRAFEQVKPDIVINASGYTAVDAAESNEASAFAVNCDGAGDLAKAAAQFGAPILHLSTDYVFNGQKSGPYSETDPTDPQSVYGRSKLAGELAVADANPKHLIIRTAWVYSAFGKNFVKTMLKLAEDREEVGVVDDQIGNPTSAADIANGLIHAAQILTSSENARAFGVYHLVGSGAASWADLARAVFEMSEKQGGPTAAVKNLTTAEYPTPTARPANSQLNSDKFADAFQWRAPDWRTSLGRTVTEILNA